MDLESKLSLITSDPTEEIVTINELRNLLQTNTKPKHYIGLEISGKLHLGSLILPGFKINDLIKANFQHNSISCRLAYFYQQQIRGKLE